jgi:hypothetical protein
MGIVIVIPAIQSYFFSVKNVVMSTIGIMNATTKDPKDHCVRIAPEKIADPAMTDIPTYTIMVMIRNGMIMVQIPIITFSG